MTKISFIDRKNTIRSIEAENNCSVMSAALRGGIKGIAAECGGNAICATCHVYVDESWASKLPPVEQDEDALLEGTAAVRLPTSRLSCQIRITSTLDGLLLRLPERQT